MTEAGEIWASQVVELHAHDVERVLRAFCREVERRAELFRKRGAGHIERGLAFDELRDELLEVPHV